MTRKIIVGLAAVAALGVIIMQSAIGGGNDVETSVLPAVELDAAGVTLTGDVSADFDPADDDVIVVTDVPVRDGAVPPQAPAGAETGWDIEDVRFAYDAATDTMAIGLNSYGIVGDPEGNGDPSSWSQAWVDNGLNGVDHPDLGGTEFFSIVFDFDQDGSGDVLAGVSSATDISGFSIAALTPGLDTVPFLPFAFGTSLDDHIGVAPTSPTADSPDIEFTIVDFSELNDGSLDFSFNAFMGSNSDGNVGEDNMVGAGTYTPVELAAELGDFVFVDTDADGVQDPDEPGVPGVVVTLRTPGGDTVSARTDSTGRYRFEVAPGDYVVEFAAPEGFVFTQTGAGDAETDSDADPETGRTPTVTLLPGQNDETVDAGLIEFVPSPAIDIEKSTNGEDADAAPGPELEVGERAEFTYEITNVGNVELVEISVTDDKVGDICNLERLAVGQSSTCSAVAIVTEGQYRNDATVTAQGTDGQGNPTRTTVTDEDPSHHVGVVAFVPEPGIDVEKSTNGDDADDAPGPRLEVGSAVSFEYVVTNTGNVELTGVAMTDDVLGEICTIDSLPVGESETCSTSAKVSAGPYRNVATATGQPIDEDGNPIGDPVTDDDPSHHEGYVAFVAAPSLEIEKATNGVDADAGPGPELEVGDDVTFTYVVLNTGNVSIVDIAVSDDVLGDICTIAALAPGERGTCEQTAVVTEGQYRNVATATGQPVDDNGNPIGDPVTDDDPSHHVGVVSGPPCVVDIRGPRMFAGHRVVWDTGLDAVAGSTLVVHTEEPGGSPGQPNEQVYVYVGDDVYGPTPVGLGTIEIPVENTGRLSFVHYSVVTGDDSMPNSVEVTFCGTELVDTTSPACTTSISGPRLYAGGPVRWDVGMSAAAGSVVRITTTEPGDSPDQPNEQVWVKVGPELFGPTPVGLGTIEFTAELGGEVIVLHHSRITGDDRRPNSVEYELCGTHLG